MGDRLASHLPILISHTNRYPLAGILSLTTERYKGKRTPLNQGSPLRRLIPTIVLPGTELYPLTWARMEVIVTGVPVGHHLAVIASCFPFPFPSQFKIVLTSSDSASYYPHTFVFPFSSQFATSFILIYWMPIRAYEAAPDYVACSMVLQPSCKYHPGLFLWEHGLPTTFFTSRGPRVLRNIPNTGGLQFLGLKWGGRNQGDTATNMRCG